jgi:pyruvate,water dikinase
VNDTPTQNHSEVTWEPPGPGTWRFDGSHLPHAPTAMYADLHMRSITAGLTAVFERFGVPMAGIDEQLVNGRLYQRLVPLVGADKEAGAPPPAAVLWLVTRLHPAFRRKARIAARALEDRVWRKGVERWHGGLEADIERRNRALQSEDLGALDDRALADHVRRAHAHLTEMLTLHFDLHGDDLGPIGDYLAHVQAWGIDPTRAVMALEGSSPASNAAEAHVQRIRAAVDAAGAPVPATVEDLRAISPEVSAALDDYLAAYGWRLVSGYDLDGRALVEMPGALLASISASTAGAPRVQGDGAAAIAEVRALVPEGERELYDDLVAEARLVCDLRDRNGPMTVAWPTGLVRRAMLEVGRRLHAAGHLQDAAHGIELTLGEATGALEGTAPLDAAAIAERAATRDALSDLPAPPQLGPDEPDAPLHLFPRPLARTVGIVLAATGLLQTIARDEPLTGTGVGDELYKGTARVARRPEDALAVIEPGDVLVVPFTTPAYNTVLAVAGAVVCEEGGPLCHAAVMARELGIPAVVGVNGALDAVADGAEVEVDAGAGRIRVLT